MKKQVNKSEGKVGTALAIGAGVAALGAVTYFFFGPQGKKNQKKVKGWMIKMKGEVVEKLEQAKEVTQPIYNEIVDKVASTYSKASSVDKAELIKLATDLKRQWNNISKTVKGKSKVVKKKVNAVKKVIKKK